MTPTDPTSRRRVLAGTGTIGTAIVAGCQEFGDPGEDDEDRDDPDEGPHPEDAEDEGGDPTDEEADRADDDTEPVEDIDHEDTEGSVSFVQPEDGDEVESPVEIEMAVEDFEVEPVGEGLEDGHGHMHLLIDEEPVNPGDFIPEEEGFIHYDDGETEDEVDLEPGEYDLVAQASDDSHVAYDLFDEISITVVED